MSLPNRLVRSVASRGAALVASRRAATPAAMGGLGLRRLLSTAGGVQLKELATANPYKDVVRYEHKNRKWSLQHVDFYSEALACGLMENGLIPGDVVLSWLPTHFSESVSTDMIISELQDFESKSLRLLLLLLLLLQCA